MLYRVTEYAGDFCFACYVHGVIFDSYYIKAWIKRIGAGGTTAVFLVHEAI
jgi:hypothetical protein